MLRRTTLFMPGNNPAMLLSAPILGADSVILDLEDAVALNQKDSARILVREAIQNLDFSDVEVIVRVNPVGTDYWKKDLDTIIPTKPDLIMIPKASKESVEEIEAYIKMLEDKYHLSSAVNFLIIAETAYGIETILETLRCSKRIVGVLLGAEDLTTDLGIARTKEGKEIEYARSKIAMACRAFNVQAIDTPFTDVDDFTGLKQDTEHAKALGFTGKALINPRQVDFVHDVFAPTMDEICYAQAIMEEQEKALREGLGVFSFRGKMVDQPIILRAQKILDFARKLGLLL